MTLSTVHPANVKIIDTSDNAEFGRFLNSKTLDYVSVLGDVDDFFKEVNTMSGDADMLFLINDSQNHTVASEYIATVSKQLGIFTVSITNDEMATLEYADINFHINRLRQQADCELCDKVIIQRVIEHFAESLLRPGLIGMDLIELKKLFNNSRDAVFQYGISAGENRAQKATEQAIQSIPSESLPSEAQRVAVNIMTDGSLSFHEFGQVANIIRRTVLMDTVLVLSSANVPEMEGLLSVSMVTAQGVSQT